MKNIFKFYKELDNRWYIDLPNWQGNKEELEMVAGADDMLNIISEGGNEALLMIDINYFENSNELIFITTADELGNGAYYKLEKYNGIDFNLNMWLCDVTKFVFGYFPKNIYFCKL